MPQIVRVMRDGDTEVRINLAHVAYVTIQGHQTFVGIIGDPNRPLSFLTTNARELLDAFTGTIEGS